MKLIRPGSRELHFYLGLFFSPLLVLFAVSTLMLNHQGSTAIRPTTISQTATEAIPVDPTGTPGSLAQARDLLRQLGIRGEIDYLSHDPRNGTLMIPVTTPGEIVRVDVDLKSRSARVSRREQGLAAAPKSSPKEGMGLGDDEYSAGERPRASALPNSAL